jgi:hypothetical protein
MASPYPQPRRQADAPEIAGSAMAPEIIFKLMQRGKA